MPRTVALTGATGFIGSHLVRHLVDAGDRVRILARRVPLHPIYGSRPIEVVLGSLEEPSSLRALLDGADAVVHCAGLVKAPSRAAFFEANAAGVRRLVEAAGETAPLRFVLLSSLAAREPQLSHYAASKRAGETALTSAGGYLAWTIVRPPAVYGPGDRETLVFFRAARRGLMLAPRGIEARFSMIHVSDLAAAVHAILEQPATSQQVLEVDDGRVGGYGWADLAAAAGAALGRRPQLIRVPHTLLHSVAFWNEISGRLNGRVPMLTRGKLRELLHPDWTCRGNSLHQLTGWQPRIPLEAGFAETLAWYRSVGWL